MEEIKQTEPKVYRIPEVNLPNLTARIAKMNKRAAKLGMEPIVITEQGEDFQILTKSAEMLEDIGSRWTVVKREPGESIQEAQDRHTASLGQNFRPTYTLRRLVLVTVTGKLPRMNGWAMAATISHDEAGNLLRTVPGLDINLPPYYRTATTECQHCGKSRRRNDTYVLQHEDGDWKQVGRNCLADFIRSGDVSSWADAAEILASLGSTVSEYDEESSEFGGSRGEIYFPTIELLAQVSACIRADGWCSRTEAKNSFSPKLATVDFATNFWDSKFLNQLDEKTKQAYAVTAEDTAKAEAAINWAQELPQDVTNDYLWNIRVVSHRERITYREAGLAGSIISAYTRHLEQELKRAYEKANTLDEYFGQVGKRDTFTLTVMGARSFEGSYGATTLYRFRDQDGRVATWFAAGDPGLDIGSTYTLIASVKAHSVYQGSKQTQLTRASVKANLTALEACLASEHVTGYEGHCYNCGEVLDYIQEGEQIAA